jgi:hypothetical protein
MQKQMGGPSHGVSISHSDGVFARLALGKQGVPGTSSLVQLETLKRHGNNSNGQKTRKLPRNSFHAAAVRHITSPKKERLLVLTKIIGMY